MELNDGLYEEEVKNQKAMTAGQTVPSLSKYMVLI